MKILEFISGLLKIIGFSMFALCGGCSVWALSTYNHDRPGSGLDSLEAIYYIGGGYTSLGLILFIVGRALDSRP